MARWLHRKTCEYPRRSRQQPTAAIFPPIKKGWKSKKYGVGGGQYLGPKFGPEGSPMYAGKEREGIL